MADEPAQNGTSSSSGQVETPNVGTPPSVRELRDGMNTLRGRLFGAIEVTGMPEGQQVAMKRLVRTITYDLQATVESALRER